MKNLECRNPERINRLIGVLQEIWGVSPDMRMGQVLVNIQTRGPQPLTEHDLFTMEDDEMLHRLQAYRDRLLQNRGACL
jgi:hypothetical protein